VIAGKVTAKGVPVISVNVGGKTYQAVIDTGFNGDLELPRELKETLHARLLGHATSLLAGGVTISEDVYRVEIPFDGQTARAEATFVSGDEILIGTHLLRKHRLNIDFAKKTVEIQIAK